MLSINGSGLNSSSDAGAWDRGKILVTGGAGFLGSHLCVRLVEEGFDVLCMDNLLTGRKSNISSLESHPRFTFIQGDITLPIEVDGPVDYILHFASPASPKDYQEHPIHTLKVGSLGTYHALGLAKAKAATFLLASSSEVYGDPKVNPQVESYWGCVNPIGPRSVYDEAKRFAEAIAMAYYRTHGVDVRIARIFNTYGPRMRTNDGRVIPNFICQALANRPITIYGTGQQTRSLCYVDDLVEAIFRLLTLDTKGASAEERVFNLGNPEEVTITHLAKEILRVTGSLSHLTFCPLPDDDPKVRCPNSARAAAALEWAPRVSLENGLKPTIDYFQQELQALCHQSAANRL